jgi:hypothetical protein
MPLTTKGEKIKESMQSEYGPDKGEQVFYASKNKGTISGVDALLGLHGGTAGELAQVKAPLPSERAKILCGVDAIVRGHGNE